MSRETAPDKPKTAYSPPGVSRSDEIDKRAKALRENLKKRKAQSQKAQDEENENKD